MLLGIDASRANNEQKTGVEWYAYFVIQELKKIVLPEVRVILYTREPLKGVLAKLPLNWQEKVLWWPPRRLWTQIRLSWEMLKESGIRNQESGTEGEGIILFVPAHVLPLVCPKKVITTIHDLGGLRFPKGYSWFEKWYARFSNRSAIKKAIIITPSEFEKGEIEYLVFRSKYLGGGQIHVIHNGYDGSLFKIIDNLEMVQAVLDKYNIHQPYFLSISRLEEKKNTVGIIEAFEIFRKRFQNCHSRPVSRYGVNSSGNPATGSPTRACPVLDTGSGMTTDGNSTTLVLLGKPGYGYDKVQKIIEQSKFKNDIILPGWVETEDVPYLMAGAEAFVFPSFYEGFGIPVLEAMACGTPVIASNRGALPEVAGPAALLVNPHKPGEIARAMREIIASPALRADLVRKGLERVKNYNWEKTAREVWGILRSL